MCGYCNQLQLYSLIKVENKKWLKGSYSGRPSLFLISRGRGWDKTLLWVWKTHSEASFKLFLIHCSHKIAMPSNCIPLLNMQFTLAYIGPSTIQWSTTAVLCRTVQAFLPSALVVFFPQTHRANWFKSALLGKRLERAWSAQMTWQLGYLCQELDSDNEDTLSREGPCCSFLCLSLADLASFGHALHSETFVRAIWEPHTSLNTVPFPTMWRLPSMCLHSAYHCY